MPEYKNILTLKNCIIVIAVTISIIFAIILIDRIKQNRTLIQQLKDEQERRDEIAARRADQTMTELHLIQERIIEIQEALGVVLEVIDRPTRKNREGEIIGMITEKLNYDYTEKALQYFREEDYANAFIAFNRALQYQRRNITLRFYQAYALYLRHKDAALSGSELVILQGLIRDLQGVNFREQEQLDFTAEEMYQKLKEMEHNIAALRQQMKQGRSFSEGNEPDDTKKMEAIDEYTVEEAAGEE